MPPDPMQANSASVTLYAQPNGPLRAPRAARDRRQRVNLNTLLPRISWARGIGSCRSGTVLATPLAMPLSCPVSAQGRRRQPRRCTRTTRWRRGWRPVGSRGTFSARSCWSTC